MPYGDGKGPYGNGPVGWKRGPCMGNAQPSWPIWRGVRTQLSAKEEREYLMENKKQAEEVLKDINQRLADLKK